MPSCGWLERLLNSRSPYRAIASNGMRLISLPAPRSRGMNVNRVPYAPMYAIVVEKLAGS
jgi:hypothetical protein